ncbi:MAG: hypothetical protein V4492_04770 [Chlamydiota bacterium]
MKTKFASFALQTILLSQICTPLLPAQEVITNPYRTDGFGAQFQTILFSMIYAELNHCPYLYTPFTSLEHNYHCDPDFLNKIEKLANLIDYYPINEDLALQKKQSLGDFLEFFESHIEESLNSQALKDVKKLFRLNKDPKKYFGDNRFNIVVHIRRPNPHDSRIEGTDTPDSIFLNTIETLRTQLRSESPLFHICSQGDENDFRDKYRGDDLVFHINASTEDTFTAMVLADALVMSGSSFSYTAALLSEGIVYYLPFWHPPMPHWKIINQNASSDTL